MPAAHIQSSYTHQDDNRRDCIGHTTVAFRLCLPDVQREILRSPEHATDWRKTPARTRSFPSGYVSRSVSRKAWSNRPKNRAEIYIPRCVVSAALFARCAGDEN